MVHDVALLLTQRAVPVPGDARDDWKIVCALSDVLGMPLPYTTLAGVRERLADVAPHMAEVHTVQPPLWLNGEYFKVSPPLLFYPGTSADL